MAKKPAKAETKAEEKPVAKASAKFGMKEVEAASGLTGASARAAMRSLGVEKLDGRYGWNTKAEFDSVVKQLKDRSAKAPTLGKDKAEAEPAAKASKGNAAKPSAKRAAKA